MPARGAPARRAVSAPRGRRCARPPRRARPGYKESAQGAGGRPPRPRPYSPRIAASLKLDISAPALRACSPMSFIVAPLYLLSR